VLREGVLLVREGYVLAPAEEVLNGELLGRRGGFLCRIGARVGGGLTQRFLAEQGLLALFAMVVAAK
jgi:hypothetical protein